MIPRVQHQMGAAPVVVAARDPRRRSGELRAAGARQRAYRRAGRDVYSLARHYRLTPMAIAKANNVGLDHRVKVGDRMVIPGMRAAPRIAAPAQPPAAGAQPRVAAAKRRGHAAP